MIDAALIADGGELSVMRPLAAYAFGAWTVTWPDDFNAPELEDERRLGFVADLPERRKPGRLARRFTRVDAEINAVDGGSNVEEILDEAATRTAGREFFEREIGPAGFGRLVPGVDVRVNDRKPVLLWQRFLPDQLVTEIRFNADGTATGQVGGQPVSDDLRRLAVNRENDQKIMAERRESDDRVRALSKATSTAIKRETTAREEAIAGESLARISGDAELSDRIDNLPTSETLNKEIVELNKQITALGGESARARDALMEQLRGELVELGEGEARARFGVQRELEGKITALGGAQDEARRRDMEALNGRISGLNTDLTLLKQTEINDLQSKWNAQQGEINKQNEQYRKLQGEWNRQQGEINQQNAKYQALDAEWKKQQHEINRQGSEFRQLQTVINDRQTGINALNIMFQQEQRKVNALNDTFRAETAERQRQDEILNAGQELALKHAQRAIDNEEKNRMRFATLSGGQVDNWIIPDVSNGCFEMRRFRKGLVEVKYSAIYVRPIKPCQGDIIVFSVNTGGGVGMAALKVTPSTPVKTELEVTGVFNQEVVQVLVMTNVNPV